MNNAMRYYFAYGSNLHPLRLLERVPSAEFVGIAVFHAYRIAFEKQGQDGSAKCNLVSSGIAEDSVYGAIYQLDPGHKHILDQYEGSGYRDRPINVLCHGRDYNCFTYFAEPSHIDNSLKPYHWYKQLVVLGARHHHFPEKYISTLESFASIEDPDRQRRRRIEMLIENIGEYR